VKDEVELRFALPVELLAGLEILGD